MTRLINVVFTALLAAVIAACGAAASPVAGGQPSPGRSAGRTGSTGSPGRCAAHVVAGNSASGSTVCVAPGGDLIVMLHNPPGANWSSPHLTGTALGPGEPIPTPSNAVGWSFKAVSAGTADISMTRPACPSPSQGGVTCLALLLYRLHVQVR